MDSTPRQTNLRRDAAKPGFDFTLHIRRLCEDMVTRVEQLRHIDMSRIAVSFSQTKRSGNLGIYASLTPLRFADGQLHMFRRKRRWGIQRLYAPDGREMLYILNFYLPRFLELPFREKLATTLHELWHVGPKFDGDVRRLGNRCYAHGSSKVAYDAHIEKLLDLWLSLNPPESLFDFLRPSFGELIARHGRVFGRKVPPPKLVPLD
jgi:predicted metallopeptidase